MLLSLDPASPFCMSRKSVTWLDLMRRYVFPKPGSAEAVAVARATYGARAVDALVSRRKRDRARKLSFPFRQSAEHTFLLAYRQLWLERVKCPIINETVRRADILRMTAGIESYRNWRGVVSKMKKLF
jgi:hypothetical protein